MGIFDNNITTPPSIERICNDIKRAFDTRMDLERNRCNRYHLGSISSVDVEEILGSLVKNEYREELQNNEVYACQTNAIKKTSGHAHVSYIITFVIYSRLGKMTKMFQYEYIWR